MLKKLNYFQKIIIQQKQIVFCYQYFFFFSKNVLGTKFFFDWMMILKCVLRLFMQNRNYFILVEKKINTEMTAGNDTTSHERKLL